jgi:hypothetical protein
LFGITAGKQPQVRPPSSDKKVPGTARMMQSTTTLQLSPTKQKQLDLARKSEVGHFLLQRVQRLQQHHGLKHVNRPHKLKLFENNNNNDSNNNNTN